MFSYRHSRLVPVALAAALCVGCISNRPLFARRVVDCSAFPEPTAEMMAAIERSEPAILDSDLAPGESRIIFKMSDADGEHWFLSPQDTEGSAYPAPTWDIEVVYSFQAQLPCRPNGSAGVAFLPRVFSYDTPAPGSYEVLNVGMDVPSREQGSNGMEDPHGVVVITYSDANRVSGYLDGGGRGPILSFLNQEELGTDFELVAAAFREIIWW